jgi:CubicO group peptidase (beta-lactamase class C family)
MSKLQADRIADLLRDLRPISRAPRGRAAYTLDERMRQLFTPGLSLAIVDDSELLWSGGFGVGKRGGGNAVTADTLFQAASISKPVFALAIMRLVKRGVVDLDADVNQYLSSWRVPENRGWQPRLTLRQLLSHTAGTTEHGFAGYPASGPWPALTDVLNGVPPANSGSIAVDLLPGLQARYSGGGTTIAQQVVADVLRRPFPDVMRELVLDPLHMARSTYEQPLPAHIAAGAAVAHAWDGAPLDGGWHVYPEMAAAGLWTTAAELAKLLVELARILRGVESALGLDRDTLSSMLRPQLPDQRDGENYWGVGWACGGKGDAFHFGHGGRNEGYVGAINLFPVRGQGAVVLLNSNRGFPLRDEIVAAISRQYQWPAAEGEPAIVALPADTDYAGTYRDAAGFTFRITQTGRGLLLTYNTQQELPLDPLSRFAFVADALDLKVDFLAGADGAIVAMTVHQGGKAIVAQKQHDPAK